MSSAATTVVVDANNLRGKLHFSFSLPEIVQGLTEWKDAMSVSSRMVVVMDHGAQAQAFEARADLLLCFSGTHKSADDVIAALIPWIQNDCAQDAVVVTEDLLLRRRCRTRSQDSRLARKLRQRPADQSLRVVTSKAFSEHLINLPLPLLCRRRASEENTSLPSIVAAAGPVPGATRRDFAEGVDLVRKMLRKQGEASAEVASRKLLALLGVNDWLPAVDLLLEGYQQYCPGGEGGVGRKTEESWERWLQAESFRRHLLSSASLFPDLPLRPLKRR